MVKIRIENHQKLVLIIMNYWGVIILKLKSQSMNNADPALRALIELPGRRSAHAGGAVCILSCLSGALELAVLSELSLYMS